MFSGVRGAAGAVLGLEVVVTQLRRPRRVKYKVVVANVGALSKLRLAVRSQPDVALLQELWATSEEVRKEATEFGYVAAKAEGSNG